MPVLAPCCRLLVRTLLARPVPVGARRPQPQRSGAPRLCLPPPPPTSGWLRAAARRSFPRFHGVFDAIALLDGAESARPEAHGAAEPARSPTERRVSLFERLSPPAGELPARETGHVSCRPRPGGSSQAPRGADSSGPPLPGGPPATSRREHRAAARRRSESQRHGREAATFRRKPRRVRRSRRLCRPRSPGPSHLEPLENTRTERSEAAVLRDRMGAGGGRWRREAPGPLRLRRPSQARRRRHERMMTRSTATLASAWIVE